MAQENWVYFDTEKDKKFEIIQFDDGNENYEHLKNVWYLCGTWKGKVKLLNVDNYTMIRRISRWKILSLNNH